MYQVNYTGLKKRDSYDEIVALLDGGDKTKIKYPDRVASQILNSPYMKMIDADSLLDMQNQQDILQKDKLKKVMIQSMSQSTGIPHVILKAKTEPPKTQFFDMSKDDDERVEEFRSAIGSDLSDRARQQADRRHQFSQAVAETLDKSADQTPIAREAKGNQAGYDVAEKSINVSPYRFPSELETMGIEYGKQNEELKQTIADIQRQEREAYSKLRTTVSGDEYRKIKGKRGDEAQAHYGGLIQAMKSFTQSFPFGASSSSTKQVSHVHPYTKKSGDMFESGYKSEPESVKSYKTESSKKIK